MVADTEHTTGGRGRDELGGLRAGLRGGRRDLPGGQREVAPRPGAAGRGGRRVHLQHRAHQPQPARGVPQRTLQPILQLRLTFLFNISFSFWMSLLVFCLSYKLVYIT